MDNDTKKEFKELKGLVRDVGEFGWRRFKSALLVTVILFGCQFLSNNKAKKAHISLEEGVNKVYKKCENLYSQASAKDEAQKEEQAEFWEFIDKQSGEIKGLEKEVGRLTQENAAIKMLDKLPMERVLVVMREALQDSGFSEEEASSIAYEYFCELNNKAIEKQGKPELERDR